MFTSKALKGLLEKEDIESLIFGSALKSIDLPPEVKDAFCEELCDDSINVDAWSNDKDPHQRLNNSKKRKGYQPREFIERAPKEASAWYIRYLAPEKRDAIKRGETNPLASPIDTKMALQFKTTFRVYWAVFEQLKEIIISRGFHDPKRKDAVGFAHDIELLILGLLYYTGWDTTFDLISTNTEIDGEVHRNFHHKICSRFRDIKDEFIYLPRNETELNYVSSQYHSYGFPGCIRRRFVSWPLWLIRFWCNNDS